MDDVDVQIIDVNPVLTSSPKTAADRAREKVELLRTRGAFGFPQEEAQVLHDSSLLRLSACRAGDYLFLQAILWKDRENVLHQRILSSDRGERPRSIGDRGTLLVDSNGDGRKSKGDVIFYVNIWAHRPGLLYTGVHSPRVTSTLQGNSKGRACVRYVADRHRPIRVDTLLIPLSELHLKAKDSVQLRYLAESEQPYREVLATPWSIDLRTKTKGARLDLVPRGRDDKQR